MGFLNQHTCPRGLEYDRCCPLANVVSDSGPGDPETFICVGYNKKDQRRFHQDRFTYCQRGNGYDAMVQNDRRDLMDMVAVISRALALDETWRVLQGNATDEQMNDTDLISLERSAAQKGLSE